MSTPSLILQLWIPLVLSIDLSSVRLGPSCCLSHSLSLSPCSGFDFSLCPCLSVSTSIRASLVAQMVKILPARGETQVQPLGWEDPLEEGMAVHSSILAWRIPWTEEPGGLQSMGSQSQTHTRLLLCDSNLSPTPPVPLCFTQPLKLQFLFLVLPLPCLPLILAFSPSSSPSISFSLSRYLS